MKRTPTAHPRSKVRPTRPVPVDDIARPANRSARTNKAVAPEKTQGAPRRENGVAHRDATGHLELKYAAGLHAKSLASAEKHGVDRAFLRKSSSLRAPLADELGREAVMTMTSAEDQSDQLQDLTLALGEEVGGPFVATTGGQEFARDGDGSNPPGATREPFPRT